jgi:hypothetical protein
MRAEAKVPKNTAQGRALIDSMDIKHIHFQKSLVMKYENEDYYLYHRPIFNAVEELLLNPEILKHCNWNFIPEYSFNDDGLQERYYSEQWTGKWWERAADSIPKNAKVLSIILYSDATTCDQLGKTTEHPVYLSLGNISNWRRNKPDSKVLLAYLPKLKVLHNIKGKTKDFLSAKRKLYQHCFDVITQPILDKSNSGFYIKTNNQRFWAFPFLSNFIGDLPEDAALTLTFNSSRSKRPCHICVITVDQLNNPNLLPDEIKLCTPINMQYIKKNNLGQEYSIYEMDNIF